MTLISLLFNPSQASTKELEATFVGRHDILARLETDLLADQKSLTPRHWQIIGPRGSGKSHLTELLVRRMRDNNGWRVARLPEENHHVASLGELLEQILIRSESQFAPSAMAHSADETQLQDRTLDLLRARQRDSRSPLLVVVENLASLFERQIRATREQARLRDILTNNPPFILIATSTSQSSATLKHSAPLYDFFHTLILDDLTQGDITSLVRARADWEANTSVLSDFERVKGRIEAIYHLSGGNPRLALALYRIVHNGVTTELHDQILKLLDDVTPYYQARLDDIPPQAARILTEMAISETVITPAEIARRCRMPTNQVTAQIRKLLDERLIVHGGRPDARSRFYEFKDRLLRIWIQMRESVGAARRLRFLGEFFERWYADRTEELEALSRRTVSDFWSDLAVGDERGCTDRLKTLSYLAEVGSGFDHSVVLQTMSAHVENSSDADVRSHIDALQRTFVRSSDQRERETLAFLLAECYAAIKAEKESIPFLQAALDEGSQSEGIAIKLIAASTEAKQFEEAWKFGDRWMDIHPQHQYLLGPLGAAALGSGRIEAGFRLIETYNSLGICHHCTEKTLRRAINALRNGVNDPEIERSFWKRLIGQDGSQPTLDQVRTTFQILTETHLSKIPTESFLNVAKAWSDLSRAPLWLFSKSICGLAHRHSCGGATLQFIEALAKQSNEPLSQFALDHLVEILPELRKQKDSSQTAITMYLSAMELVRKRSTPTTLGKAFRFVAPYIVKRLSDEAGDLIALYREWQQEGLLTEAITPYSEAISILDSEAPPLVLQSLHPEIRDAVTLILQSLGKSKSEKAKGTQLQSSTVH